MKDDLRIDAKPLMLREQVVNYIRAEIRQGHLSPGTRLGEAELCEATGVSRTSVREALRQLEAEGLVANETGKGPYVARLSAADARDIVAVLETLLESALSDVPRLPVAETGARLTAILADDARDGADKVVDFLLTVFQRADNRYLSTLVANIADRLHFNLKAGVAGRRQEPMLEDLLSAIHVSLSAKEIALASKQARQLMALCLDCVLYAIDASADRHAAEP